MRQIAIFIAFTILGYILGGLSGYNPIDAEYFHAFAAFALVVGLYGSVVGIDLAAIQKRRTLAIVVITIAVPLQILATGLVMYLIHPFAISFLIAVAMTQIDPLSVDTLLQDKDSMSEEAKGILRIWASFDDPVTVIFGFLVLLPLVTNVNITAGAVSTPSYFAGLAYNLVPALGLWLVTRYTKWLDNALLGVVVLVTILTFAYLSEAFLLAAITGLLLRPIPEKYLSRAIAALYYSIVFVVGMAIFSYGVDLRLGLLLAIVEFFVIQPLTTIIVFNGTAADLLRIAFAQQNGLTTLLMGIAFQSFGVPVLHILLPGIIAVNLINLVVNKIYNWKEQRGLVTMT